MLMPYCTHFQVEVTISGADVKEEGAETEAATASLKVLPPWMIKQGMNLTKEQRGELRPEAKVEGSDAYRDQSDEKKQEQKQEDVKSLEVSWPIIFI